MEENSELSFGHVKLEVSFRPSMGISSRLLDRIVLTTLESLLIW